MMICIGDSITYGSVGVSYVKFVDSALGAINKGVNGDTLIGMSRRLRKILKNKKYNQAELFVLEIGTNDVLIPWYQEYSFFWKMLFLPRQAVKAPFITNEDFYKEYEKNIKLLLDKQKKVILVGLPLWETLKYDITQKWRVREEVIIQLSEKYHIPYIDLYKIEKDLQINGKGEYIWSKTNNFMRIWDAIIMLFFHGNKDLLSKSRGLEVTVDGIHPNTKVAMALAQAIEQAIF